ncbi:hypothetical protein J3L16_15275 [Alteromonas sp. 5E99-2]|uniref:hypothetical protein n=1 Tax=Alteromonas sp. 5E99-2 TaxID=2817683 RepID=UPI001A98782D|nr:hypothetical protein [Alteromonas sp. 5E99-2]MBO1257054.1 hypothetical protein [Alteromonas sp. 5E99-2]
MSSLEQLKLSKIIWNASTGSQEKKVALPFLQASIDKALQGGLAQYGLLNFHTYSGSGELSFLSSVIKAARQEGQYIALINPPGQPNTHWFQRDICSSDYLFCVHSSENSQNLWAFEQCIMSGVCAVVLAWNLTATSQQLRRCHVKATQHGCKAIWFSSPNTQQSAIQTPCSEQLALYKKEQQWYLDVLKQQGGWPQMGIQINNPMPISNNVINRTLHASVLSTAINH